MPQRTPFRPGRTTRFGNDPGSQPRNGGAAIVGAPACSKLGPAGAGCEIEVSGSRILVQGAQASTNVATGRPLVIDVRVVEANGGPGTLLGTCNGGDVCTATISTARLPHGVRLRCQVRSSAGPVAFSCSPFSSDSPLDYTMHLRRQNGTEEWLSGKVGTPQLIDAAGTGSPDATVLALAGPAAAGVPSGPPTLPPDTSTTNARVIVTSTAGTVIPYALEVYYQTDHLFHFGFDGRAAGAPVQFDATIAASASRVDLHAVPTGAASELTLLGGAVDGTLETLSWPTGAIRAAVQIGPVPPAIDVTIEPAGHAIVSMSGSPNVRATIDQFTASSEFAGKRSRTVADLPQGAPATLDFKWNSNPVDGQRASTFTLNPTPLVVRLDIQHTARDVVRDLRMVEKETLRADAIASILGIPAGDTVIQMIGEGDRSKVVLTAPSAIGSIEFGFGDGTLAAYWPPPVADDDYFFMRMNADGTKNLAVRVSALVRATVESKPSGTASVLGLSMTHTPKTLHLFIEKGAVTFFGSLVPPAVTEAEIVTDGSKITVKPTSSGDIEDIELHARSADGPFFGKVREIDLTLSNVGPDTTITVASSGGNLTFTFAAVVPIDSLDAQLRAGATPHALLPAGIDGLLLHQDDSNPAAVPFTAHLHLSGLTNATVTKVPSVAPGAKPDDLKLSLDLEHSPRSFAVNVLDGVKKIWGSFLLPQLLAMTVDIGNTTASVGATSTGDVRDIDLHLRTSGAPFFGRVKQMDLVVSNIPVGASFGVTSNNDNLTLAYTGGTTPIASADAQLREADAGDTLPAGKDGVLLHDLTNFSAHFHLSDLLAMSAQKSDCGSSLEKCQHISARIQRATQRDTVVDIQTVPDDTICRRSGSPPVWQCALITTTPDSTTFTLNGAPTTLQIGMKAVSDKVNLSLGSISVHTAAFRGIEFAYGATEASGGAVLAQRGASSQLDLAIASLPSGSFDEGNRHGNAVFFCVYKSAHCTTPPHDVHSRYTNPSMQFFATSPVNVTSLFTCSSQDDCSAGKGIHALNLSAQALQFAYAEVPGTVYNDRYIYADTSGHTASGRFWMNSPNIDLRPSNLWANGAQVQLGALYAPVKSHGKIDCDALNFSVEGVFVPPTALRGLTALCA